MYKSIVFLSLFILLSSCQDSHQNLVVHTSDELKKAISDAKAGDEIVMANGTWKDVQIRFTGYGTENKPVILRAETAGKVFIEGVSDLKFGGEYLVVSGLYFRNGHTPTNSVIEYRINQDTLGNHCRVTNSVIENYNQLNRDDTDLWVQFWGRNNKLDHCYIAGKSNRGPTVRVDIRGNESIRNYHQIVHNHFGPRPPKGGPSAETIQLGNSSTSMSPSNTLVAGNLFERCNGEVEVISSKTNYNEFRNNVFYKCEGSLVTRHGNYCIVDGNFFIGDETSEQIGGVRIINTGHWITNNYFINLKGQNFRSPLAVMNGIPRSPLNRYMQVTDVVIAHNSWINCTSPWQFGVGSNVNQKDVLPASEIRSARPTRTIVANNLIFNEQGDTRPIVAHDKLDGINFKNNFINNQEVRYEVIEGLEDITFDQSGLNEYLYIPKEELMAVEVFAGFDFETIQNDLFGNLRVTKNAVGAICGSPVQDPGILDKTKYGTDWYTNEKSESKPESFVATPTPGELEEKIAEAGNGDIVLLAEGTYQLTKSLPIDKEITIKSEDETKKARLIYSGPDDSPAFRMMPGGNLTLESVQLIGNHTQNAFASLKKNMSSLYNLHVSDCRIENFQYILKAYKQSFAYEITFSNTDLANCQNGIELSEETNDRGDYNAENLIIDNCRFDNIKRNVIDYYRGGYDESTIGGLLSITNSSFSNSGGEEENGILLNTYGIVNVDISNNTFKNNQVKMVALLWGAKNNSHSDNQIVNSGKMVVEENLKLRLVY